MEKLCKCVTKCIQNWVNKRIKEEISALNIPAAPKKGEFGLKSVNGKLIWVKPDDDEQK